MSTPKPVKASPQADPAKLPRFIINVALADDNEPRQIFIGANGQDYLITRGKEVEVPVSVLGILDNAIKGVPEADPVDPEKTAWVNRQRFPYTVVRAL